MLLDRGLLAREASTARRPNGNAGDPRDAARARGRAAGRPQRRGATADPGRGRAREDVQRAGAGGDHRARRRQSWSRCSQRSYARRCSRVRPTRARRSAASTPSCRTCSDESPTRPSPGRDRKTRHLAAVEALEQSFASKDQDVPEVIAAHLLAAAEAAPDDDDTREIQRRAQEALVQAGDRAAALAAPEEAQPLFRPGIRPLRRSSDRGGVPRTRGHACLQRRQPRRRTASARTSNRAPPATG